MASHKLLFIFCFLSISISLVKCDDSSDESSSANSNENQIDNEIETNEANAAQYLKQIMPTLESNLQWALDLHFRDMQKASLIDQIDTKFQTKEIGDFLRKTTDEFKKYKYWNFTDNNLKRQIEVIVTNDYFILRQANREKMEDLMEGSKSIENDLNICSYKNSESCEINHSLMLRKMLKTDDVDELQYYWKEWRDKAGQESRQNFKSYITLYRQASKLHNFKNPSDMFLTDFEDEFLFDNLTASVAQLHDFFQQLHAHVRYILRQKYGDELVPDKSPIPEHLLEKFILEINLENPEIDYPFPESKLTDLTAVMQAKNYTPTKFFSEADDFFTSMKIQTALNDNWKDYITLKEDEGCYPRAVSLYTKVGIGFFYCKEISFRNYLAVHSEMFKVQRDLQTKTLPLPYRVTRTDAFFEGLSDSVQLSVSSPAYLHKIGLLDSDASDPDKRVNFLYLMAIRGMFQLQREFAASKYYLESLDSKMPVRLSNCDYWEIVEKYVGVQPPVERNDDDFDFISMLYEDFDTDLIDRVFAKIISYEFYEGLCKKSGRYVKGSQDKSLDNCDFSGSEEAGKALSDLIKHGSAKKWQELMKIITDRDLEASALLKYFEPLRIWLEDNNKKNNVHVGWDSSNKCKKAK